MGIFSFLFNKKKENNINYEEIINYSWNFFREGLLKESPQIRRYIEEALVNITTPQGKRFFSAGLQEPDIDNKIFCLKNIYKNGGWRLAEELLNFVFSEEIELNKKLDIVEFLSEFSDSSIVDFINEHGFNINNELKIPIFCCLISSRSKQAIKIIEKFKDDNNELEDLLHSLILYQFDYPDIKNKLDNIFINDNINVELFKYLKYLEFNKSKFYFEKNFDKNKYIQLIIINCIKDNRGNDLIKELLKSSDKEIVINSIKKIIEIGSKNLSYYIENINLKDDEIEKYKMFCKAYFGDKHSIEKLISKIDINLSNETLEILEYLSSLQDQDISTYLNDFLKNKYDYFLNKEIDLSILENIMKLLIKSGKISSIPFLKKYVNKEFLDKDDLYLTRISSLAAASIICIMEKNTTYILRRNK
jgi:hypothetical protein